MKFVISQDGTIIVNSAFVRTVFVEKEVASYKDSHTVVKVKAELNKDSSEVTLSTFDSGNLEADFAEAQAYLKNLFAELNGVTK
ncbi:MAG: hypothetical protein IJQ85_07445 [Selenomonadaceae bacterium]|nr:hypothetical protein [Selenomonadaceae bacterium]